MAQNQAHSLFDIPYGAATDEVVSLDLVKAHIRKLVHSASRDRVTSPVQSYFHSLLTLESALLSDILEENMAEAIVCSEDMQTLVADSQSLFSEMEVNLEDSLISAYQSMRDRSRIFIDEDSLAYNYLVRYRVLAQDEASFMGLTAEDRMAFIGAGPFPISAMEFAKISECRVEGIEILGDAAALANNVVSDFGLPGRVSVSQSAGQNHDYSGFSVILVGVLAEPKSEILLRIAETADRKVRVFCRTTHGLRKMIYRPTAEESLWPFRVIEQRVARGFQTLSTLALSLS